jgi:hypothetical protein
MAIEAQSVIAVYPASARFWSATPAL